MREALTNRNGVKNKIKKRNDNKRFSMIELKNVDCGYGKKKVLNKISVDIEPARFTCLLGENGAGKTTLFKTILGLLPALDGKILYDGREHSKLTERDYAGLISYVPQVHNTPFPYRVLDVVLMGQYIYSSGYLKKPGAENLSVAEWSINLLGIEKLTNRCFSELSGGEKQMVLIARAVAQKPQFIALDEPTANLDMGNQMKVLQVAVKLKEQGYGIIMNTHSPQHALQYADEVIMLRNGGIVGRGKPKETLNSNSISSLYETPLEIVEVRSERGEKYKVLINI